MNDRNPHFSVLNALLPLVLGPVCNRKSKVICTFYHEVKHITFYQNSSYEILNQCIKPRGVTSVYSTINVVNYSDRIYGHLFLSLPAAT